MKDVKISRCYTVSAQDMLDIWIESFHHLHHIVVIWDAKTHFDLLKEAGLKLDMSVLYNNKILTIQVDSMDDALKMYGRIPKDIGPHVQIYSLGKLIKDNIED